MEEFIVTGQPQERKKGRKRPDGFYPDTIRVTLSSDFGHFEIQTRGTLTGALEMGPFDDELQNNKIGR